MSLVDTLRARGLRPTPRVLANSGEVCPELAEANLTNHRLQTGSCIRLRPEIPPLRVGMTLKRLRGFANNSGGNHS